MRNGLGFLEKIGFGCFLDGCLLVFDFEMEVGFVLERGLDCVVAGSIVVVVVELVVVQTRGVVASKQLPHSL